MAGLRATTRTGRPGLTLIECILAMMLLSMAVVAVSLAVTSGQKQEAEALHQSRAAMLAESLMDEIVGKPYADPDGSSSGETGRGTWDNIADYASFTEAAGNLKDAANVLLPASLQGFGRSATVQAGTVTVAGLGSIDGVTITVTVSKNGSTLITLTRFVPDPAG